MSEEKRKFENGVEYYVQFDNDSPLLLATSEGPIETEEDFIANTLTLTVKPEEDSKIEWIVSKKKFKIFAKQKG